MNHYRIPTKDIMAILASMLLYVIFLLNWWLELFRSTSTRVNYLTMILVLMIPLYSFFRAVVRTSGFRRIIVFAILGTLSIFSTIALLLMFLHIDSIMIKGVDPTFEYVKGYQVGSYRVSAYRTNGGATTDFGIYLRQEKSIGLGLMRVKKLDHVYHASGVEIKILDFQSIQCKFDPEIRGEFSYEIDTDL